MRQSIAVQKEDYKYIRRLADELGLPIGEAITRVVYKELEGKTLINIKQLAELLDCHYVTIYKRIENGQLKPVMDKPYRFHLEDFK